MIFHSYVNVYRRVIPIIVCIGHGYCIRWYKNYTYFGIIIYKINGITWGIQHLHHLPYFGMIIQSYNYMAICELSNEVTQHLPKWYQNRTITINDDKWYSPKRVNQDFQLVLGYVFSCQIPVALLRGQRGDGFLVCAECHGPVPACVLAWGIEQNSCVLWLLYDEWLRT